MSKYSLVDIQIRHLRHQSRHTIMSTIQLPAGTTTTFYPDVPSDMEDMTVAELKAYAIRAFEKANDVSRS